MNLNILEDYKTYYIILINNFLTKRDPANSPCEWLGC